MGCRDNKGREMFDFCSMRHTLEYNIEYSDFHSEDK